MIVQKPTENSVAKYKDCGSERDVVSWKSFNPKC
jgi:hypothetical protein